MNREKSGSTETRYLKIVFVRNKTIWNIAELTPWARKGWLCLTAWGIHGHQLARQVPTKAQFRGHQNARSKNKDVNNRNFHFLLGFRFTSRFENWSLSGNSQTRNSFLAVSQKATPTICFKKAQIKMRLAYLWQFLSICRDIHAQWPYLKLGCQHLLP